MRLNVIFQKFVDQNLENDILDAFYETTFLNQYTLWYCSCF